MLESAGVHQDNLGSILAGDRGQSPICITSSRGNVVGDTRGCAELSARDVSSSLSAYREYLYACEFVFGRVRRFSMLFSSIVIVSSCFCTDDSSAIHRIRNILIDTYLRTRRNMHLNNEANTFGIVPSGSAMCRSERIATTC
jgi:hypothetical protein